LETKRWEADLAAGAVNVTDTSSSQATVVTANNSSENETRKKTIQVAAANTAKSISNALEGFAANLK
jgi:hypothetical protein